MTTPPTIQLERKPGSKYTEAQIQDGLTALALCNGSARLAERLLDDQGRRIPKDTLQRWKDITYAKRYLTLEEDVREKIWTKTSRFWRNVIEEATTTAVEAIEETRTAIRAGESKEANAWSSTAKNLTLAGGIATDKAAGIEQRPMGAPAGPQDLAAGLKALERLGGGAVKVNWGVLDSTATDVTSEREKPALPLPRSTPGETRTIKETREPAAGTTPRSTGE